MSKHYTHNDGGREASGRKGTAGDCSGSAVDLDYDYCYTALAQANKNSGRPKSVRNGIMRGDFNDVLVNHGWIWIPAPKFSGRKARCSDMPSGTVIARQARHFVAVIDGVPQDIFDSSEKMVYGYWQKVA